ncbi:HTH-type transcriptional regulator ImmR [Sporomusa ovata DSM 2662]|uniref:Transcriptional regulator, XRE family n=1 Tax=Sporomusa ovata TaxID=2378 RepID=A0A0U1L1A7_9FIRM|nr:XRE family transcriptional regulator [Sporomusa ovata]EQB27588.1 putative Zn peptidase [Sporomusa ovata DSM 2662]CQR73441.1 Transcriptional regulator, XRE family [Sporomusa ovata]
MEIGKRLLAARKSAQMTLKDVAERMEMSHTAIAKYEKDQVAPNSTVLIQLSKVLKVPVSYFFEEPTVQLTLLGYRKRNRLTKGEMGAILEKALDWAAKYQELEEYLEIGGQDINFQAVVCGLNFPIAELGQLEEFVPKFRERLQIGQDAIEDLVELLEDIEVKVLLIDGPDKFDAVSYVNEKGAFLIVTNRRYPLARSRFTLAHELGHIVFHLLERQSLVNHELDEEKFANRFAGAFLIPAMSVYRDIGKKRTSFGKQELIELKRKYGLSMQALVYRAKDLGIITEDTANKLFKEFRRRGWHRIEPDEEFSQFVPEQAKRFERLVARAVAEQCITQSKAREFLYYLPNRECCEVM